MTMTAAGTLLGGGVAIGLADLAFAFAFWWPRGVPPPRILQSIAAGVLGPSSYAGGIATAALGMALHFFIATMFVLACHFVLRRLPALARRPLAHGAAYGALLYLAMNLVVLPLSAAGMPGFGDLPWVASSIAVHMAIGVACFLFARRALPPSAARRRPSAPRPAP